MTMTKTALQRDSGCVFNSRRSQNKKKAKRRSGVEVADKKIPKFSDPRGRCSPAKAGHTAVNSAVSMLAIFQPNVTDRTTCIRAYVSSAGLKFHHSE